MNGCDKKRAGSLDARSQRSQDREVKHEINTAYARYRPIRSAGYARLLRRRRVAEMLDVVIDPSSRRLTHCVVQPHDRTRLVPIEGARRGDGLRVRMHGSAALDLAWLAAGRLNATLMLSNFPWDVTAGLLLVREAGGLVYDYDGSRTRAAIPIHAGVRAVASGSHRPDRQRGDVMRARHPHRFTRTRRAQSSKATTARVAAFAPAPILTVTIDPGSDRPEVHLHSGGQGFWVARMATNLGAEVALCCSLGGEPRTGAPGVDRERAGRLPGV